MESLAANGRAGVPFWPLPQALVERALDVLREAVAAMVEADGGLTDLSEPELNNELRRHLAEVTRIQTPPMEIHAESAVNDDKVDGAYSTEKTGEPDFRFQFVETFGDSAKYLALECKRMSGSRAGNHAADYVTQGVARFVQGAYSKGHSWALMAAYVYEGRVSQAAGFVVKYMQENAEQLYVIDGMAVAQDIAHDLYSSRHIQAGTDVRIRLIHYFAAIQ